MKPLNIIGVVVDVVCTAGERSAWCGGDYEFAREVLARWEADRRAKSLLFDPFWIKLREQVSDSVCRESHTYATLGRVALEQALFEEL